VFLFKDELIEVKGAKEQKCGLEEADCELD
jgi:hypothetical protein